MSDADPLRVLLVGAGTMGRRWADVIRGNPHATLVGVVDLDLTAAQSTAGDDALAGTDLLSVAHQTGADAVVDVTIPAAHHQVTTTALLAGLDVLGEKPLTPTVAEALSLIAATAVTGRRFVVSQSRRYNQHAWRLRQMARALGAAGTLTSNFFRAPHFGGFRDRMEQPLLVDMAIHQFDIARFLLDADPVAVYAESYNPPWSWFDGDAAAVATFEMSNGARYVFNGSWCAQGQHTSWNSQWHVSAEHGSAQWDGETEPALTSDERLPVDDIDVPGAGITGSFADFVTGIRHGTPLMCEAADNLYSLAMVEAAIASAATGDRVSIESVLAHAHSTAVDDERHGDIRDRLRAWAPELTSTVVSTPR